MQMPNSRLVCESSFHNMLYLLLSPLLTIHPQQPYQFPNIEQSNYDAMKYSYNPRNTQRYRDRAEESKNNHFSRDIFLFYDI